MKNALFITIEGIEGVGKSTAISYLHQLLTQKNIKHHVTREPGGTEIAESIRRILLEKHKEPMAVSTELLLMFAARAQHIEHVIKPALARGTLVLCDRFTDASFAYQGGGRGIEVADIVRLEKFVQGDLQPDLTLLLDASVEVGMTRISERGDKDRFESEQKEFFERIRNMYLERAKQYPNRFRIIDASRTLAEVELQLKSNIEDFLYESFTHG